MSSATPIALPVAINNHWHGMTALRISENDQDFHQALWWRGTVCKPGFIMILWSHHQLHSSFQARHQQYVTLYEKVSESRKANDLWFKTWVWTSICNIDAQVLKAWRDEERLLAVWRGIRDGSISQHGRKMRRYMFFMNSSVGSKHPQRDDSEAPRTDIVLY